MKTKLKLILNFLWVRERVLLGAIAALMALGIFLSLAAGTLAPATTHRALVETVDNDAGQGIAVASRSLWFNDNGFRYYGPLYYRIAHTVGWSLQLPDENHPAGSQEHAERAQQWACLLVSLAALMALGWLIAASLFEHPAWRFLGSGFFALAFLNHPVWATYLLTVHPDLFLGFVCALAAFFTLRWAERPDDDRLKWAAIAWACATSTKLSTVFFLPSVLTLVAFASTRGEKKKNILRLLKISAIAYFAVGFPQNFDLPGVVGRMMELTRHSSGFTVAAFQNWWRLWSEQVAPALPGLAALALISWLLMPVQKLSRALIVAIVLLPASFLLIASKTINLVHDYYPIPFVTVAVICLCRLLAAIPRPNWSAAGRARLQAALLIVVLFAWPHQNSVSPALAAAKKGQLRCRPELQTGYRRLMDAIAQKQSILGTPYAPVPVNAPEDLVSVSWNMTISTLQEKNPQWLVTSKSYYDRFLGEEITPYVKTNNPDWEKNRELFLLTAAGKEIFSAGGQTYRLLTEACGVQFWERIAPSSSPDATLPH